MHTHSSSSHTSPSAQDALTRIISRISRIPSIAMPPVLLPDLHMKEKAEAPCSFVVATEGTIVPELTAPSVGCGMGVITTSLTRRDITPEFSKAFYAEMQKHRGPKYTRIQNILLWMGIKKRPHNTYDFTPEELGRIIYEGAPAVREKYEFTPDILSHMEYGGNVMNPDLAASYDPHDIMPRAAWVSGLHDVGYGFKGNHFLEIQYVEDVLDEETANTWGLKPDQVVIMYHGGGGAVSHYLGRYFANRKKKSNKERPFLFIGKVLFHFGSWKGIRHMRERWQYYFAPRPFQEIPLDTYEGKRVLASIQASLNYSYAFRLAIVKRISDALLVSSSRPADPQLLWDTVHNSISRERISEKDVTVHRHTATRAFDGRPVIVSGFNTTSSYIGLGLPQGEAQLFSADHGGGETIKKFREEHKISSHPQKYTTDIYMTKPPYHMTVSHITNEGIDHVMNTLEHNGVTRSVVRLRPLAVFKG